MMGDTAAAIKGKKILVTGGAGFIGSTLIERLIDANKILVLDTFDRDALSGKSYASHPNLEIARASVLDINAVRSAAHDAQLVIHCAGIAGIDTVIKRPTLTMQVNMIGSANVLAAAAASGVCERIVCFSTSEVFGQYAFGAREDDRSVVGAVGEARWTYAVSKLAEEHLAIAYHREMNLPAVVVRPFNVYGPGQIGEGALRTFILRALCDQTIQIHGDGTQIRAWCYVDDMVEGVLLALLAPGAVGESFNIGNRRSVETIYGLANTVVRVLESKSQIEFVPKASADVELRIPATEKASQLLGFDAKVGMEEGIRRTAAFYRARLEEGWTP
jgi:UDP-glucose 4-epimerase